MRFDATPLCARVRPHVLNRIDVSLLRSIDDLKVLKDIFHAECLSGAVVIGTLGPFDVIIIRRGSHHTDQFLCGSDSKISLELRREAGIRNIGIRHE